GVETDHEIASQRTLTRRSAALGDCGIHFVNGNDSTRLAGRALALLHERSTESWTIEMLAARVGMSRSVFAERFGALVGASPMHYLTAWRMHVAAQQLGEGPTNVAQVAFAVGY